MRQSRHCVVYEHFSTFLEFRISMSVDQQMFSTQRCRHGGWLLVFTESKRCRWEVGRWELASSMAMDGLWMPRSSVHFIRRLWLFSLTLGALHYTAIEFVQLLVPSTLYAVKNICHCIVCEHFSKFLEFRISMSVVGWKMSSWWLIALMNRKGVGGGCWGLYFCISNANGRGREVVQSLPFRESQKFVYSNHLLFGNYK